MQKNFLTRFPSLDIFRGLTIALMIMVNSPGNSLAYSWLEHSEWSGCTFADLVFPFFIVIVGISSVLALTKLKIAQTSSEILIKKIIKRSLFIFILGLGLNVLPNHFDITHLRFLGVLQRISICYFFSALCFLYLKPKVQIQIIVFILVFYWLLLSLSEGIVGDVDKFFLGSSHMYRPYFDPEGILSTFPALASVLLGNLLGYLLVSSKTKEKQLKLILYFGLGLAILGWLMSYILPLNKALWSSSYVLWTSGLAFLIFGLCFYLIELKSYTFWAKPFIIFGKNSLLVYVLHVLFLKIQAVIYVHNEDQVTNLKVYLTNLLFSPLSLKAQSFCYALTYTLLWLIVLYFYQKRSSAHFVRVT